ncbi:RNA binding protein, variant 2 [Loa loa]|uniref:RNA binding protein, variant 2 n=1 Tax=Loa loa TaxID=7209 RepID=A0A1S0UM03_LOALO|nr:RNA binding protein, variant 2 [Loa loa]EJD76740.1 RNA binding protein, variant 2 [Loa loa]
MLDWSNPLLKAQAIAFAPLCIGNLFMFIALLTPAWQVAEDTDAHRYMQSGLWMYCPGGVPCWYIFSDNLINYYEKVDVCRFLLIGDCRKKLIKTPYFFVLFSSVGLAVFVINAEMLESRFLIGVKNTFKKEYGYSFYLAGLACMFLMFGLLAGVMVMSYIFLTKSGRSYVKEAKLKNSSPPSWRSFMGIKEPESTTKRPSSQTSSYPTIPVFQNVFEHPPRPGSNTASQSVTPLPPEYMSTTRTFFSY